jgi:hypothetical protein
MLRWFGLIDASMRSPPSVSAEAVSLSVFQSQDERSIQFDANGRLVQSRVYDRTSFSANADSSARSSAAAVLRGLLDFRAFYASHDRSTTRRSFYRDTADVDAMLAWLNRSFPGSHAYDSHKIIFSPLVAYSQSATWLESNGFRELQAHVNYPYPEDVKRRTRGASLSKEAETVLRGDIVFTELNHGYINPEADRYADRVLLATSARDLWVDSARDRGSRDLDLQRVRTGGS